jgi:hypothetical protein
MFCSALFINELYTVLDLADRFTDGFGLLQHWARTAASFLTPGGSRGEGYVLQLLCGETGQKCRLCNNHQS